MTTLYRVLWSVAVIVAAIGVVFFFIGIGDGTVSSFNIVLWVALLAGLAIVVFGSRSLQRRGRTGVATAVAALLAVPALLFGALLVIAVATGVRWN
jgi:hypothetical protein